MTYFALRHSSGALMPGFRGRAGGTHVEPLTDPGPPRLFASRTAASNALRWWLEGRASVRWVASSWESPGAADDQVLEVVPVPGRLRAAWEVVEVEVAVVGGRERSVVASVREAPAPRAQSFDGTPEPGTRA